MLLMFISFQGNSDKSIETLISQYSARTLQQANLTHKTDFFKIEPYIDIELYGEVNIGFKIGYDRFYVIKDLTKFNYYFKTGASAEYGGSCHFKHDMENLDEQSKKYARFILTHTNNDVNKQYNSYVDRTLKKYIKLDGYLFDDFFAICNEDKIKIKYDNINITASIVRKNPALDISLLRQENNSFKLSIASDLMTHRPFIFKGGENTFVLLDNALYFCDNNYSDDVSNVLIALTNNRRGLVVSKDDMQIFSSTVLKPIKRHFVLQTDANTKDLEPSPLTSKLYLDMQVENYITARLVFYYGNKKHDAFKQKNLSFSTDLKGEFFAEALVKKYFKNIDLEHNYAYIDDDENAIFDLVNTGLDEIEQSVEIYATEKFKKVSIKPPSTICIGVRAQANLLDLNFDIGDYDSDELIGVLNAYKQSKKYYRVKNGSFVTLNEGAFKTFFELAESLDISDKDIIAGNTTVSAYRALYLDSLIKQDSRIKFDRDSSFKKIIRDIKYASDSDFIVPLSLTNTLRSYQKVGFRWMKTIGAYGFSGILADDMGLGKTLQVITLLLSAKLESSEKLQSIVVCPSSLVYNWQSEINRFAPDLTSLCIMGNAVDRSSLIESAANMDILITSYDILKRDIELYKDREFLYEIIDEAQYIKNHTTQNALAVKVVKAKNRLALTGTPVENSLAELWSIYDYLMPGYLYSYSKFKRKFELPIVRENDDNALQALKRLVSPFILRRMKSDVLKELPPRVETTLYATLEGEQKKLYLANVAAIKQELISVDSDVEINKISVLAMLTKLRQICCTPALLYDEYSGENAKLDMCVELIENCISSGHKLLLFSQFTSMLKIIEQKLQEREIEYYKITGSTRAEDRLNLVNSFNSDDTPVFLISLKAGGTGLNLTGADVVIHFDPWWNVSAQNQATDRAHRIGQKNSVQIYKLIAKDTIEEKILDMQAKKAELANMVINGSDGSIARMNKEDILNLFI